ncbi:MAG: hypothetical protein M1552_03720 [Firmicutes bacterium]|nr:hypothetical protein [Bacillota bacterium]MCL5993265.1 hypothetical protein [Bacillota bacterium]
MLIIIILSLSLYDNENDKELQSLTPIFKVLRGKPNDVESRRLAACLQNGMFQAVGLPDKSIRQGNFHVIRETTMCSS